MYSHSFKTFKGRDMQKKIDLQVEGENFAPLLSPPSEGEYILVQSVGKKKLKYVAGKVLKEVDKEGYLEISYLRRHPQDPEKFRVPPKPDIRSARLRDVKLILPNPSVSTEKRQTLYQFNVKFDRLQVC